jgi:cytochrome d ubiquinol oxidase subunit I
MNDLQEFYEARFGPGDWWPIVPVAYWTFRLMVGAGFLAALAATWFLWSMRRGRLPGRLAVKAAILLPFLPLAANSFGWIFTETGRQPWIVHGLMTTADGVSPAVSAPMVALTLVGFTVIYGALAAVAVYLLVRRVRAGLPEADPTGGLHGEPESSTQLGY